MYLRLRLEKYSKNDVGIKIQNSSYRSYSMQKKLIHFEEFSRLRFQEVSCSKKSF